MNFSSSCNRAPYVRGKDLRHADLSLSSLIGGCVFSAAQICNLLVSPEIVASSDDFSDATGARRSRRFNGQNLQAEFAFHKLRTFVRRSGVNAALRSCRLRCAAPYRRIAFRGITAGASVFELSDALPITNRRYGRLQICATTPRCARNTYPPTRPDAATPRFLQSKS